MLALDRFPSWLEGYNSVEYTSKVHTPEEQCRVGTSAHATHKEWEWNLEITESLENEKITYRVYGRMTMTVTCMHADFRLGVAIHKR